MQELTHEQKVARACYCLDHDKRTGEQAPDTARHIQELADRELARVRGAHAGWVLTPAGRKMSKAFLELLSRVAPSD